MNKGIVSYLVEIVMAVIVIIITLYMVNNNSLSKVDKDFVMDNNIAVKILENNSSVLRPMSDRYAKDNAGNIVINVTNYNNDSVNYKLFMRVEKNNNLNYNYLKIKVDDDIFRLNTKYDYEDEDYLYFDIGHKNVDNYNNVNFAMWLDEDAVYDNYSFSYNFYIERI